MGLESPKSQAAEARLPAALQPIYRQLVEHYAFITNVRYGRGYVAYEVIADLVLAGWRPGEAPATSSPDR